MKEKWSAWVTQFRDNAVAISDLLTDAAYGVGKKAEAEAETLRRRCEARKLQTQVDDLLRQLGAMLYATHTGNPTDSDELLKIMEEIDRLKAQIAATQPDPPKASVCPVCGDAVCEGQAFCQSCGQALKEEF